MKHYTVEITNEALADMEQLYNHIAYVLQAPENAMDQYNRIADAILTLDTMAERIRIMESEPERSKEMRRLLVDNYSVFFVIQGDGGISKEAQADSLCSTFRHPEAGPKDLPDGVFAKRRDYHQGRAGSIPETLGRTGTFFDERAQRIIPERTGRYAHSGNQWGIKRTSKEDPLK